MNKPSSETITYYYFTEVTEFIKETYNLSDDALLEEWKSFNPYDGEILVLHIADYIVYKKYNSEELLRWYQLIRKEFGDAIILCWDVEEEK